MFSLKFGQDIKFICNSNIEKQDVVEQQHHNTIYPSVPPGVTGSRSKGGQHYTDIDRCTEEAASKFKVYRLTYKLTDRQI